MSSNRITQLLYLFENRATIAQTFGMTLSFTEDRSAVITMPYHPGLTHALDGIHGGVFMTLLDSAAWFTSAASHEESIWVATSELTVHFLRPAAHTSLRCVGKMIKAGKRQDIVEAHLYDGEDQWVGHGIGTFAVLPGIEIPPIS
jgi:uncharacterized protein (TIGR00369 family)